MLAQRRFTPLVRFGDGAGDGLSAAFAEAIAIPAAAAIGKVSVISDSDGALVTRTAATGAAPTAGDVAISDPSIERDPVTLTWKRSAGTTSAIFFSPDDGASWRPLAFRVTGESFVINPETLAGTAAGRFAVATTDGLRGAVTQLTGVTVSVSNAAPTIEITSPRPEDPSPSGLQPIVFSALAGDRDQDLGDDAVVWSSDRDGELGRGATLTRGADTLTEGKHTITATVTDDEGATAKATVEIEVFRVPPPPPSADKSVTASAPAEVTGGDQTTVTVKVSNAGPSRSRALRLTATLPAGTAAGVPDDGQGWTCTAAGRDLICERPQLMPAETTTLKIPVATDAVNARTTRTVDVAVDSAVADPLPQDDRASVSFDVVPRPPAPPADGGGASGRRRGRAVRRAHHPGADRDEGARAADQAAPCPAAHEQVRRERRHGLRSGGLRGNRDGHGVDPGRVSRVEAARRQGEHRRRPQRPPAPPEHQGAAAGRTQRTPPPPEAQAQRPGDGPRPRGRRQGRAAEAPHPGPAPGPLASDAGDIGRARFARGPREVDGGRRRAVASANVRALLVPGRFGGPGRGDRGTGGEQRRRRQCRGCGAAVPAVPAGHGSECECHEPTLPEDPGRGLGGPWESAVKASYGVSAESVTNTTLR